MNPDKLRIVTREKELIMADIRIVNFCKTFSRLLEDSSPNEDIPIDVDSKIFKIIVKFIENHNFQPIKELPKPLGTHNVAKFVTEYDDQLMNALNEEEKLALILACGYLDFQELFEMCIAYEAAKYIGKTWDEIRKEYEIPEEMTKDLVEKMHKDYEWAYNDAKN